MTTIDQHAVLPNPEYRDRQKRALAVVHVEDLQRRCEPGLSSVRSLFGDPGALLTRRFPPLTSEVLVDDLGQAIEARPVD